MTTEDDAAKAAVLRSITAATHEAARMNLIRQPFQGVFFDALRDSTGVEDAEAIMNILASEYTIAVINFVRVKLPDNNIHQLSYAAYLLNDFNAKFSEQAQAVISDNLRMMDGQMEVPTTKARKDSK